MNARGRPLTQFENFKAKFSEFLDKENKSKLDNEWLDIFWNFEKNNLEIATKNVDEKYFNFFVNITLCFYLEQNQLGDKDTTSEQFGKYNIFEIYEKIYQKDSEYVKNIISILNSLLSFDDTDKYFLSFLKAHKEIDYFHRLRFYATACFFIKKGRIDESNETIFENWIRVCRNLINNNTIIMTGEKDFIAF
jgi:hypothetical protein